MLSSVEASSVHRSENSISYSEDVWYVLIS
jgi:hypothetical protein